MTTDDEFTITRVFNAPRELVWKVHSDAEHLARWWGPKGFEWISGKLDFRPGGMFHYCMRSPVGPEMWGKFVYHEIVRPELIVFVNSFSDATGATLRAPFAADFPLEVMNRLTLSEQNGKTTLTLRGKPVNASDDERKRFAAMNASMNQGFGGTYAQLDEYLTELQSGA